MAHSRSGIRFDPRASRWSFRDEMYIVSINFESIPTTAKSLIHSLKVVLIWYFENWSARTSCSYFERFLRLLKHVCENRDTPVVKLYSHDILNFKMLSRESESTLGGLVSFLKKWQALGLPGLDDDVLMLFKQMKLRDHPTGVAVSILCPKKGPFTDLEFEAIQQSLNNGFATGKVDESDFWLVWLFIALGGRSIQMASMKLCDFNTPQDLIEGSDYWINFPLAKQLNVMARDQFIPLFLSRQIAEPLHLWVLHLYQKYSNLMVDPWQAPLFPREKKSKYADPKGYEYHSTSLELGRRVTKLFNKLGVPSERINQFMNVTSRRFRYTYGTRLAEEGCTNIEIARLMGHSNTTSAQIYVALTGRMIEKIDKATAIAMAPLAQAFMGRIINTESDATRPIRASRIIDLRIDQSGAGLGSCGQYSYCGFCKPTACYACTSFEPWLDGPHEAALEYMIHRREELMKVTAKQIAAINDRAILGCAQIILRCREIKGKME